MKKAAIFSLLVAIMLGIAACSGGNTSSQKSVNSENPANTESEGNGKKYTIKIGNGNPPGEPAYETFEKFVIPELKKRSNGRFEIQFYPQNQLGSENEMLEQVKVGTIQVCSASAPAHISEKLNIFYLPYLFPDQQKLWEVLDGPLGKEINADVEAKGGVKVMGWWSTGVRHMFTKNKEIRNVEDVKGLKIRVMEQPVLIEIFKGLGMLPTPLPYSEVYGALTTGIVDAAENDPSGYKNMKFYEVAPNYSLTYHMAYPKLIAMNPKFYNELPDDLKKVVDEVFAEAEDFQRQMFIDIMDKDIQELKDKGVNVIEDVDVDSFRKKAQELWTKVQGVDQALLNKVLDVVRQ